MNEKLKSLLSECKVDTYRSGGPGGQKVNKTDSAVRLHHKPSGLIVYSSELRSQYRNKIRALEKLQALIDESEKVPVERIETQPTEFSKQKRVDKKKKRAKTKALRRKPMED